MYLVYFSIHSFALPSFPPPSPIASLSSPHPFPAPPLLTLSSTLEFIIDQKVTALTTIFSLPHSSVFKSKINKNNPSVIHWELIYVFWLKKRFPVAIFLDHSKALNTVNEYNLLPKLNHNGIAGLSNHWFKSYLKNRSQFVNYQLPCPLPCPAVLFSPIPSFH